MSESFFEGLESGKMNETRLSLWRAVPKLHVLCYECVQRVIPSTRSTG